MSQKRILLVEDNEFNRKIVRDLLARQPYDLLEAHDGEAGVAAARRDKPEPDHHGRPAAQALRPRRHPAASGPSRRRRRSRSSSSPRSRSAGDDKKAMDAGASAYLAKPYSPRQLLDTIRKMAGDA